MKRNSEGGKSHCFSIKEFSKFRDSMFHSKGSIAANFEEKITCNKSGYLLRAARKTHTKSFSLYEGASQHARSINDIVGKYCFRESEVLAHSEFAAKERLWRYIFELQDRLISLHTSLKEAEREVEISNQIQNESVIIRQDLEHQIESLAKELASKDLAMHSLTISTSQPLSTANKIEISEDPLMDLKILMAEDNNSVKEYAMLKEVNEALQAHVKQLLSEKRELAEWVKCSLETANEEKKVLEAKAKELQDELQIVKMNKEEELKETKESIEKENKLMQQRKNAFNKKLERFNACLLYTSPSPRDLSTSRMPSSACKKKKKK
eukprot:TRINITY_DN15465_c0_g1_i2.p1 TRINITY_DN15465_c0_g1~~TRINITY_DN15465_c0_g1_i2.p1  ORF type:complete len:323 (-),score=70.80 TRINITY_DN15465_c0_g1_i2:14-982(-)